jgi:hypothetical protein
MVLNKGSPRARLFAQQRLRHRQQAPDLTEVRGPEALHRLPETERKAWGRLWADVAEVLKRAEEQAGREARRSRRTAN